MLIALGAVYMVTQIVTRVALAAIAPMDPTVRVIYTPLIRIVMIANSCVNLFIYIG